MDNVCVVVADGRRARLFLLEESDAPRAPVRLVARGALGNASLRSRGRSVTGRVRTDFGLIGLNERVKLLGGSLRIESSPGAGTRVEVVIPLEHKT
jgi:signal transduction histidine kinase